MRDHRIGDQVVFQQGLARKTPDYVPNSPHLNGPFPGLILAACVTDEDRVAGDEICSILLLTPHGIFWTYDDNVTYECNSPTIVVE